MSLFNALMGNMEEDPIFGCHMSMMRQMNNMMSTFWGNNDPFSMMNGFALTDGRHHHHHHHHHHPYHHPATGYGSGHHDLLPFPPRGGFNQLLGVPLDGGAGYSYSSSTVVSTTGPDGTHQMYKATSSTRTGPGGIKETQRSVTDSRTGTKKMAIGHHIGDRAHIVEKEHNFRTGDREEREDFINLDEDEADEFNQEWTMKSSGQQRRSEPTLAAIGPPPPPTRPRHNYGAGGTAPTTPTNGGGLLAITAAANSNRRRQRDRGQSQGTPYRIKASPLTVPPTSRTPYAIPGHGPVRKNRNLKTVHKPRVPSPDSSSTSKSIKQDSQMVTTPSTTTK